MPTSAHNVPLPFVLPLAALYASDRLSIMLMTLVDAIGASITDRSLPDAPTFSLFFRLSAIIRAIIRLTLDGPRPPAKPKTTTPNPAPTPRAPSDHVPTPRLPPGWILDLLPDTAPAVAADLAALLADPACVTLLALAPTLHRRLRPVLRALGLTPLSTSSAPPPATPPPATPSPATPHPNMPHTSPTHPAKPAPAASSGQTKNQLPSHTPPHAYFITVSQ